jgi:hypothetical protein
MRRTMASFRTDPQGLIGAEEPVSWRRMILHGLAGLAPKVKIRRSLAVLIQAIAAFQPVAAANFPVRKINLRAVGRTLQPSRLNSRLVQQMPAWAWASRNAARRKFQVHRPNTAGKVFIKSTFCTTEVLAYTQATVSAQPLVARRELPSDV